MRVSVLVLNWNGKKYLKHCLDSLHDQKIRNFEVLLVDNGSRDGSVEFVLKYYPWVRLIRQSQNLGFAEGNNRGLTECCGEYIVTLNNDTKVDTGFLEELVAMADNNPEVGMVAAKMLNFFDENRIDSVGTVAARNGLVYNIGSHEQDVGQFDVPISVFGPNAGAALYKREMIDEVGFFDADFFAYYEDFDLAWRGRLAGWRCMTAPKAVVYHMHSATSGEGSPFKIYHLHRNKWFTILENWPRSLLIKYLPLVFFYDMLSIFLALFRGRGRSAFRARLDLLLDSRALFSKRAERQKAIKLSCDELDSLFSSQGGLLREVCRKMRT